MKTVFTHLSIGAELGFFRGQTILILISQMVFEEPFKTRENQVSGTTVHSSGHEELCSLTTSEGRK